MSDLFKQAAQQKLRFTTSFGELTAEDLFDLHMTSTRGTSLDDLARKYNKEVKDSGEESFVLETTSTNKLAKLKFDIVIDVIETKKAVNKAKLEASEKAAKKAKIVDLIARKQEEEDGAKSIEELTAMLEELG